MSKTKDKIQQEALSIIIPLNKAGVGITMGGGKTLVGLKHMDANYTEHARFLVVAPKLAIHNEWKKQALEHKLTHLVEHMRFTTYRSLPKQDLDYDVIYLDECHSLLDSHESWLQQFKGKIIGLTGTPPKYKKSGRGKLIDTYCPIVYKYLTDTAVQDKLLNDYRIHIHLLPLDTAKTIFVDKGDKQWYTSEYAQYTYWSNRLDNASSVKEKQMMSIMRMKAMMSFPSKEVLAASLFKASTNKCILFANTQEQADRMCFHSYHASNTNSETNLELFNSGEIMKLSCVQQLSEGANIKNLKEGIIMHSYGNERKSPQRIGRLLRLNPKDRSLIHILCYKDTIDEAWVKVALEGLDTNKIIYK